MTEKNGETTVNVTGYTYDSIGQLLTETVNGTVVNTMTYDGCGNILSKNGTVYSYGDEVWKDKLTAVGNESIVYDSQGNPTSYFGNTLVWEKGRQLASYGDFTFSYNANGIRTKKRTYNVTHNYTLDGTKILKEVWGTNTLIPLYDNGESVCGIVYNGTPYYFVKNLQGDIIRITDANGTTVVKYSYDAWGKPTTVSDTSGISLGYYNPFRYRGYYYDAETGLYYLQSRYYDANVGRFINGDDANYLGVTETVLGYNLFSYCENDCINNTDTSGNIATFIAMAIGALFGLAIQWTMDIITNIINKSKNIFKRVATKWDYICAALNGAIAATGIGKMAAMFWSGIVSLINYIMNCVTKKAKYSRLELILTFAIGIICGFIGGSGANLKKVTGVVKTSRSVLKTAISNKKIAMYTSKIRRSIVGTVVNAIRYIMSSIASTLGGKAKNYLKGLV